MFQFEASNARSGGIGHSKIGKSAERFARLAAKHAEREKMPWTASEGVYLTGSLPTDDIQYVIQHLNELHRFPRQSRG
jgi:hypothetical protein